MHRLDLRAEGQAEVIDAIQRPLEIEVAPFGSQKSLREKRVEKAKRKFGESLGGETEPLWNFGAESRSGVAGSDEMQDFRYFLKTAPGGSLGVNLNGTNLAHFRHSYGPGAKEQMLAKDLPAEGLNGAHINPEDEVELPLDPEEQSDENTNLVVRDQRIPYGLKR